MSKELNKDLLIDAISKIDDGYLESYEQLEVRMGIIKARKKKRLRTILITAACLALVGALLLCSLPVAYIANYKTVNQAVSQVVDDVIFPNEGEDPATSSYADWVEWELTDAMFVMLGAGTDQSAIQAMKQSSGGLTAEMWQNLGKLLERMYEYYLDNKDYVDSVIDELESEISTEIDIESILPPIDDPIEDTTEPDLTEPPEEESTVEGTVDTEPPEDETTGTETETEIEPETEEEIPPEIFAVYEPMNLKLMQMDDAGVYYVVCGFNDESIVIQDLIIPNEVNGIPVKVIGENAFHLQKDLKTVELPDSLETIFGQAFSGCAALTEIEIPASVTKIGNSVFSSCSNLRIVTFEQGSKLSYMGNYVFQNAGIESINIPSGLKKINDYAFQFCYGLKQIVIPETVTYIGACSFMSCTSLESVTIFRGSKVQIQERAFSNCNSLVYVELGNTYLISTNVFENCDALQSIIIPATVTNIGSSAFRNCDSLEEVNFLTSNGKLIIHEYAFAECQSLKQICFPAHLNSLLGFVLYGSESIEQITLLNPTANYSISGLYLNNYLYSKHTIHFNGTKEQWQALGLECAHGINSTIICTDGYIGVKPE